MDPAEPRLYYTVMANPGISVSTKAAYEAIDTIIGAQGRETDEYPLFVNDLESYTLRDYPEAARLRTVMQEQLDADIVMMSGSGPTVFGLFVNRADARTAQMRIRERALAKQVFVTNIHGARRNQDGTQI